MVLGFCGDRKFPTINLNDCTGTTRSYYKYYQRILSSNPSIKCLQLNDLYTTNTSNNRNKALKYSVATIIADEYVMAGSSGGMFIEKFLNLKDSSNYLKINR